MEKFLKDLLFLVRFFFDFFKIFLNFFSINFLFLGKPHGKGLFTVDNNTSMAEFCEGNKI